MLNRMTVVGLLLGVLLLLPGTALAQGGDSFELRMVCVTGFGCGFTPLSDDQLTSFVPDGATVLEPAGDYTPDGAWVINYDAGEVQCTNMNIPMQAEVDVLSFTGAEPGSSTTEGELELLVEGLDTNGALLMDRLAPGIFNTTFQMEQEGIISNFTIFAVMTSETTMAGNVMANWNVMADVCFVSRTFTAEAGVNE
jgi:hypothetical protein